MKKIARIAASALVAAGIVVGASSMASAAPVVLPVAGGSVVITPYNGCVWED